MLVSSRRAEEVRLRTCGEHQKIALIGLSFAVRCRLRAEVNGDNLCELHIHTGVTTQDTGRLKAMLLGASADEATR